MEAGWASCTDDAAASFRTRVLATWLSRLAKQGSFLCELTQDELKDAWDACQHTSNTATAAQSTRSSLAAWYPTSTGQQGATQPAAWGLPGVPAGNPTASGGHLHTYGYIYILHSPRPPPLPPIIEMLDSWKVSLLGNASRGGSVRLHAGTCSPSCSSCYTSITRHWVYRAARTQTRLRCRRWRPICWLQMRTGSHRERDLKAKEPPRALRPSNPLATSTRTRRPKRFETSTQRMDQRRSPMMRDE